MKYAEYRKGAGFLPNLYSFWLSYCQTYILIELMRFIQTCGNRVPSSQPVWSETIPIALVFFFRHFFWLWLIRDLPKKDSSPS